MPLSFQPIGEVLIQKVSFPFLRHFYCSRTTSFGVQRQVRVHGEEQPRVSFRWLKYSPQLRRYSATSSISSINAQRNVPIKLLDLHTSLSKLQDDAILYVNLSQLRLALRGLESKKPVTRIAGKTLHRETKLEMD